MLTYLQKFIKLRGFCLRRIQLIHHRLSDGLLAIRESLLGKVIVIIA